MSDDIVTRLRETATEERPLWRSQMVEAADEIESLRKQVTTWISCAERLVESNHEDYKEALGFYRDCQRIVNEEARR